MSYVFRLIALVMWVSGVIIAKGFWSTLFALLIPFWAWYLTIEKLLTVYGII